MANWRYFEATGQVGGTTALQYVDSFNGDDANPGTHLLPKQSIQGAFDAGAAAMTLVLAGYFNEGDFINNRSNVKLYPEGFVTIDGTGYNQFWLTDPINHHITVNEIITRRFGTLMFRDFFSHINRSAGAALTTRDTIYMDMPNTMFGGSTIIRFELIQSCLFINTQINSDRLNDMENCTFINSKSIGDRRQLRNNYFDENSVLDLTNFNATYLNHNFYEGTMTNKIRVGGTWYNNVEALQAATSFEADSLPSTTDPKLNEEGYSLQEDSPLINAGWDKRGIGYIQIAKSTLATTVGVWTLDDLILDDGKFKLDTEPVGTATSSLIQVFNRVRNIVSINLPNFVANPYTGETIGRLASDRTPYAISVEIQYSTDGSTTNGAWLRVPIGTKPYHDTVNDVGNDDPDFDMANAQAISASHLRYRITLRNNETLLT